MGASSFPVYVSARPKERYRETYNLLLLRGSVELGLYLSHYVSDISDMGENVDSSITATKFPLSI